MSKLWRSVLEVGALSTVFQPVVDIRSASFDLLFFECLTRGPKGTNLEPAGVLFEFGRRKGREAELDRLCIAAALEATRALPARRPISINVHLATLDTDRALPDMLAATADLNGVELCRVTLELIEHAPTWVAGWAIQTIAALRKLGVRIALDDVGAGHASFRAMLDCEPDYLKIDRRLVQNCERNPRQRAVIEALVLAGDRLGARVIAEGVETETELQALRDLGIEAAQGHLIAAPAPAHAITGWNNDVA